MFGSGGQSRFRYKRFGDHLSVQFLQSVRTWKSSVPVFDHCSALKPNCNNKLRIRRREGQGLKQNLAWRRGVPVNLEVGVES